MATTLAWGEPVLVTMSVGYLVNQFTLNDPDLGLLDGMGVLDGNLEGLDVTDYVMGVRLRRGRSNELAQFEAGSISITLNNNDRRFDPINQSSPYWDASVGRSGVQPRRRVTLLCDNEYLFDGAITAINITYDGDLSTCVINAADDFTVLSNQTIETTFTPPVEISGTRITSILDLPEVNYSQDTRSIATGGKDLQALPIEHGTNVLQYLQQCAQADQALLFVARNGDLTYTDPLEVVWYYDVTATFVDSSETLGVDKVPYTAIATITDQTFLFNKIIVSKNGGMEVVSNDTASQDTFGISTLSLLDLLLENQSDVADVSTTLLTKYKDPVYRFDDMQFVVNGLDTTSRETLNRLEIGDSIQVVRTFSTGTPSTVEAVYQIERLEHTITPTSHTTTIGLGDIKTVIYPLTLNDAVFGTLDSTNALV